MSSSTMGYRKRRDKSISPQGVPKMVGWPGERADSTKGYRRRMDESISPQGIPEMPGERAHSTKCYKIRDKLTSPQGIPVYVHTYMV